MKTITSPGRRWYVGIMASLLCIIGTTTRSATQGSTDAISNHSRRSPERVVVEVQQVDWQADGLIDEIIETTSTTDSAGQLLLQVLERKNADGTLYWTERTSYNYDSTGHLLSKSFRGDWNADGHFDSGVTVTNTYDRHGNVLTRATAYEWTGDEIAEFVEAITNSYDARGKLLTEDIHHQSDGMSTLISTTMHTYDRQGRLVSLTAERHLNEYSGGDHLMTTTYTYDHHGNVLTEATDFDLRIDGSIDTSIATTNTYDPRGKLLTRVMERGFDPLEPATDYSYLLETTSNTYDQHGDVINTAFEWDMAFPWDADYHYQGGMDTTNTYDRARHLVQSTATIDIGHDGNDEYLTTTSNTYDTRGRLIRSIVDETQYGWRSTHTTSNRYDEHGRVVTTTVEHDYDANGTVDQRFVTTTTYGAE